MGEEAEMRLDAEDSHSRHGSGPVGFWNPPSRKSAIRDSLQALSSGLPSSLWAGGERPLAGPRAGTGTGTGCGRGTLRCTSAAVAGEVPQTFKSVPLVQCRGLVPFEWHSDSVD
ncbi:hypothetical protein TrVGV298_000757 [Trichoderma virens]|nr:hypothetical protein TrVGV298_000757 [Trichoderma virens]